MNDFELSSASDSSGNSLEYQERRKRRDDRELMSPTPSINDEKDVIFNYVVKCIQQTHSDTTKEDVRKVWKYYEEKTKNIILHLEKIRNSYSEPEDKWKKIAYSKSIISIRNSQIPIASGKQARKLDGIGKNISKKIDDIINDE